MKIVCQNIILKSLHFSTKTSEALSEYDVRHVETVLRSYHGNTGILDGDSCRDAQIGPQAKHEQSI